MALKLSSILVLKIYFTIFSYLRSKEKRQNKEETVVSSPSLHKFRNALLYSYFSAVM